MHKKIHRFESTGIILSDADIPRKRKMHEEILVESMRENGYIRVLDLDVDFSTSYIDKKFHFIMSVYGIYVGQRKAQEWEGYSMGRYFPRHIQSNKREQSYQE